jgi:protein SCO1
VTRRGLVLVAAVALAPGGRGLALGATPAGSDLAVSATPVLPRIRPAPDFSLLDAAGRPVVLSGLRPRVVLVSFIYTNCADTCPLLSQRMAILRDRLERAGLGQRVHFLSITIDPERDSANALARYATHFHADPARWQFLRETPERLRPVLAAYDEWTRARRDGDLEHPARLYLIDGAGEIREIYSLDFFDQRQAFVDIRALLRTPPSDGGHGGPR